MSLIVIDTLANLRAQQVPVPDGAVIYWDVNENGQRYAWNPSTVAADNGGSVIRPTGHPAPQPGAFVAQTSGESADVLAALAAAASPVAINGQKLTNVGAPTASTDGATKGYTDAAATNEANLRTAASALTASLDVHSQKITSLLNPTASTDAANKAYVDAVAAGLSPKNSVLVASTANVVALTGEQTIDGVLTSQSRVLLKDQSTASQNGVWVTDVGAWTRPTDFATGSHASGAFVFVEEGTANVGGGFVCTTAAGSDVVDTNNLAFTQFSGAGEITAGTGLSKSGNTLNVVTPVTEGNVRTALGASTGDIPANSQKITGLAAGVANTDAANVGQVGEIVFSPSGGDDAAPYQAAVLADTNGSPVVFKSRSTYLWNTTYEGDGLESRIYRGRGATIQLASGQTAFRSRGQLSATTTTLASPPTLYGNILPLTSAAGISGTNRLEVVDVTGFKQVFVVVGIGGNNVKTEKPILFPFQAGATVTLLANPTGTTSGSQNSTRFEGPMLITGAGALGFDLEDFFDVTIEQYQVRNGAPPGVGAGGRFFGGSLLRMRDFVCQGVNLGSPAGSIGLQYLSCQDVDLDAVVARWYATKQMLVQDCVRMKLAGLELCGGGGGTGLHVTATNGAVMGSSSISLKSGMITNSSIGLLVDQGSVVEVGSDFDILNCTTPVSIATGGRINRQQAGTAPITANGSTINLSWKQCGAARLALSGAPGADTLFQFLVVPGCRYNVRNDTSGGFNMNLKGQTATVTGPAAGKSADFVINEAGDIERVSADQ